MWQANVYNRLKELEARFGGRASAAVSKILKATQTWDPAATAATQGAEVTVNVTVAGAAVGDSVVVSHTALTAGIAAILVGQVSAANTVTVRLINTTAAAVNLATGTLKVLVLK